MNNDDLVLIKNFKSLMRRAMLFAQYSHDYVFDEKIDNSVAVANLNVAASKFASAESLYYSCINVLEREEAEDIFHLFNAYMQELLNNYRDNHSHQWTDIEFQRLKEFFDSSVFAFEND